MSNLDFDLQYDFGMYVDADARTLLISLAETHSALANLHVRIAFLRAEEARDPKATHVKAERMDMEGLREALTEKKWLLVKLLDR